MDRSRETSAHHRSHHPQEAVECWQNELEFDECGPLPDTPKATLKVNGSLRVSDIWSKVSNPLQFQHLWLCDFYDYTLSVSATMATSLHMACFSSIELLWKCCSWSPQKPPKKGNATGCHQNIWGWQLTTPIFAFEWFLLHMIKCYEPHDQSKGSAQMELSGWCYAHNLPMETDFVEVIQKRIWLCKQ